MSLLLVVVTTHKANTIPLFLLGLGAILTGPAIRLREQARQQLAVGKGASIEKVKWLERAVIGCGILLAAGAIGVIADVSRLP
ncbi:hypothetical protein [Hymenobacter cheonanensis]|uniref:hypothetical protein n=1 Tax=Hymenobacter sp. CA2-7 TaxID=3063993 RepID=UPI00271287E5|nr:hypothetical protein [Hymenobacter sp. CA2-7]MDO7887961.1 hypothetical protein [Hymenobacter sp. CA2-7]